jgi:hypothetical protein
VYLHLELCFDTAEAIGIHQKSQAYSEQNGLKSINTTRQIPRTSQETHYISATETNRLMFYRETVAVYCENRTDHSDALCGQNTEI